MRIKGKFGFKELKDLFIGFTLAIAVAFFVLGIFTLISFISWGFAWMLLALLLTPIGFWFVRFYREEITIEPIEEDEIESVIKFEGE